MLSKNKKLTYSIILIALIAVFIFSNYRATLVEAEVAQGAYYRGEYLFTTYYPSPFGAFQDLTAMGNVGIGTTAPKSKLHVYDDINPVYIDIDRVNTPSVIGGLRFRTTSDQKDKGKTSLLQWTWLTEGKYEGWDSGAALNLAAYDDNGDLIGSRLFINRGNGNIGIGTTSPIARLELNPIVKNLPDPWDYISIKSGLTLHPLSPGFNSWTGLYIATPTGGSILHKYALVTETGAGNVGIGTTAPDTSLVVNGPFVTNRGTLYVNSTNASLVMVNSAPDAQAGYGIVNGGNTLKWLIVANPPPVVDGLSFIAGSTGVFKITSAGDVGIMNGTPTAKLDINGTTGYNQLRMRASYTPTSSSDTNGNTGDIAWDGNYTYVKTSAGWKRAALSSW